MHFAYSKDTLSALGARQCDFLFKYELFFNVGLNFCLVGICMELLQSLQGNCHLQSGQKPEFLAKSEFQSG